MNIGKSCILIVARITEDCIIFDDVIAKIYHTVIATTLNLNVTITKQTTVIKKTIF